jgi:hypothetical protein
VHGGVREGCLKFAGIPILVVGESVAVGWDFRRDGLGLRRGPVGAIDGLADTRAAFDAGYCAGLQDLATFQASRLAGACLAKITAFRKRLCAIRAIHRAISKRHKSADPQ